MIKPDDIPAEMVDAVEDATGIHASMWHKEMGEAVAAILNAAIEAGIVSPPVRILRSRFGVLEKGVLYVDDNEAQSHASPGGSSEHYWGQTS